jgi:hypothetical protein
MAAITVPRVIWGRSCTWQGLYCSFFPPHHPAKLGTVNISTFTLSLLIGFLEYPYELVLGKFRVRLASLVSHRFDLLLVQAVAAFARRQCPAFRLLLTTAKWCATLSARCMTSSPMVPTAIKLLIHGGVAARTNVPKCCWCIPLFYENNKVNNDIQAYRYRVPLSVINYLTTHTHAMKPCTDILDR